MSKVWAFPFTFNVTLLILRSPHTQANDAERSEYDLYLQLFAEIEWIARINALPVIRPRAKVQEAIRRYGSSEVVVDRTFVGRQPIYRDGVDVFAYELLSRDSELNRAAFTDSDRATARLLLEAFVDIGLDQVVGRYIAFVNVTPTFLLSDYCFSLTESRVVVEIGGASPAVQPLLERLSVRNT